MASAPGEDSLRGSAYLFRNFLTANGVVTESARLTGTGVAIGDGFGERVAIAGDIGLVSAAGTLSERGAAYVFRNLSTATGNVTQSAKLQASDGAAGDLLGFPLSLSGSIGLLGANQATVGMNAAQGAAYVFRNLDTVTGTVNQSVKLLASDGGATHSFGSAVGISGDIALVGAPLRSGALIQQGGAYLYRNLNTATGTVTETARLVQSDPQSGARLGTQVAIQGTTALVSAPYHNNFVGAVYLYRGLGTATGDVAESARLVTRDAFYDTQLGVQLAVSGNSALITGNFGNVYLFQGLDTATGVVNETLRIFAPVGDYQTIFGDILSMDGDAFAVGDFNQDRVNSDSGVVHVGRISSMTTLDVGNVSRTLGRFSFVSQSDWVVGQNSSGNSLDMGGGTTANVTAAYIGKNAGANNNVFRVDGEVTTSILHIGATGNSGNVLTGRGRVIGPVVLHRGNRIDPGPAADLLRTGSQTWEGGAIYAWDLREESGTSGAALDRLQIDGSLSIGATSADRFTLRISGINANYLPGIPEVFDPFSDHEWTIATTTTGITGFNPAAFDFDLSATPTAWGGGSFSVLQTGNDLILRFHAVPEPSQTLLLGSALLTLQMIGARRLYRRHSATSRPTTPGTR